MKRVYSLMIDILLLGIECVPFIIILNGVFELTLIELSVSSIAFYYILNSLVFRFTRLNQTLGDIVLKIEMRSKDGNVPKRYKFIIRDLLLALGILNTVNGLFSSIGLLLFCLPVGKHKETGHIIILSDVIFSFYYQDSSKIPSKE